MLQILQQLRQTEREQVMTMKDWAEHLDRILTMSGAQLLQGNGNISHKQAVDKATDEYSILWTIYLHNLQLQKHTKIQRKSPAIWRAIKSAVF